MRAKYELKNFIEHYGLRDTLDALVEVVIEEEIEVKYKLPLEHLKEVGEELAGWAEDKLEELKDRGA